jgi:1-acyl-sn-glycerol-3-phosphate acyltransferase
MCPEGTRTSDGQIGEFKKGAFYLALKARPVIVPLAIVGAYEARNRKSWFIRPSIIRLRIGQPLMPEQYEDIGPANLADFIREKVISLT